MNFVASPTVVIFSAASSGISTPNSSSNAITNDVEAISAQIIDEACILSNLIGFNAKVLNDNFLHAVGSIAHVCPS